MRSVTSAPGYLPRRTEDRRPQSPGICQLSLSFSLSFLSRPLHHSPLSSIPCIFYSITRLHRPPCLPLTLPPSLTPSRAGYLRPLALYISYPLTLRVSSACPLLSCALFASTSSYITAIFPPVRSSPFRPLSPPRRKTCRSRPSLSLPPSLALVLSSRVPTLIDYGKHHEPDVYGGGTRDARGTQSRI